MSIEKQLKDAFQHTAARIDAPSALDHRIMAQYRGDVQRKRGVTMKVKLLPRLALIILAIALIVGFAYSTQKLLFKEQRGALSIEYRADEQLAISPDTAATMRAARQAVWEELVEGEAAVLYVAELELEDHPLIKEHPLVGVVKYPNIASATDWSQLIATEGITLPVQDSLPGSFTFAFGREGSPYGEELGVEGFSLLTSLREASRTSGEPTAWERVAMPELPGSQFTSHYHNASGEQLHVIMGIYDEQMMLSSVTSRDTAYEQITVGDTAIHYTANLHHHLSDTGVYKELFWMTEASDRTYMYRIASDSIQITKEQLLDIAAALHGE